MTYTIKRVFAILSLAIFGSVLLYNCEPDPDALGEQLFLDGAAQGNEKSFDLIAYNIDNHDSIRSDAAKLGTSAVLGVFNEGQFGRQKASYFTQLRLSTYNPDFGTNAVIDSVVLVIKPTYASDSITTTTDEDYIYPDGNVAAKKVVNTYPVTKFGTTSTPKLTIKVNEVTDFLNASTDIAYSNTNYAYNTTELGSKEFFGTVNSVTITKDSDASSLFTSSVGFRIPLLNSFFKTKIIDMKGKPELSDASNFIRYFRGLRISVMENEGYLMQFNPNDMELIMYYKYDEVDNGTTTRPQTTYTFSLGSENSHIGHYDYDRTGAALPTYVQGNTTTGDQKLYTQGMGGPSIGIKIPQTTIDQLKQLYETKKAGIISAKIRIYTDAATWSNNYGKPNAFTIVQRDKDTDPTSSTYNDETTTFTTDLLNLVGSNNFALFKGYDLDKNPAYYDFTITKSLKDIVETGVDNTYKYFKIDVGSFLADSTGSSLAGYQYTSRTYATDRVVFIGSDPNNANKVQLKVIYGTK